MAARERLAGALERFGPRARDADLAAGMGVHVGYVRVVLREAVALGWVERNGHGLQRHLRVVGTPGGSPWSEGRRRHLSVSGGEPAEVNGLPASHKAVREGRTLFPGRVVPAGAGDRLLMRGLYSPKLGDVVMKGWWAGAKIYALSLEERATCPASCPVWRQCYGNGMPHAKRMDHRAPGFLDRLGDEVAATVYRDGRVMVRLHGLGDFFSVDYVRFWAGLLNEFTDLAVFGYTAWPAVSPIGREIDALRCRQTRFAIRRSVAAEEAMAGGMLATVIRRRARGRVPEGVVCPAQTDYRRCCASCGLCWSPNATHVPIVFMMHGRT